MFTIAVGHSDEYRTIDTINSVIYQCNLQISTINCPPIACFVAIDVKYNHKLVLEKLADHYPNIPIVGCSSYGQLSNNDRINDDSLLVTIFCSDEVKASAGYGNYLNEKPRKAIHQAVQTLKLDKKSDKNSFCLIFGESLFKDINWNEITNRLRKILPSKTVLFGGIASDNWEFKECFQFYNDKILRNSICLLMFQGTFNISYGIANGWSPTGESHTITSAKTNKVFSIDNISAYDFFKTYLGHSAITYGEFPLMISEKGDSRSIDYLRAPLSFDPETGVVTFGGELIEGSKVNLGETNRDAVLGATNRAIEHALKYCKNKANFGLIVNCAARKYILGTRTSEESKLIKRKLGLLPFSGLYVYGEIFSTGAEHAATFNNQTILTIIIG